MCLPRIIISMTFLIFFIVESIHIFQSVICNKKTFSNINLLIKVLLIVGLVFLKMDIRKAFYCYVASSEDKLKLNSLKSYLCQLLSNFHNFSQFHLFLVKLFYISIKCVFAHLHDTGQFLCLSV